MDLPSNSLDLTTKFQLSSIRFEREKMLVITNWTISYFDTRPRQRPAKEHVGTKRQGI
jgi:hypothetical protein